MGHPNLTVIALTPNAACITDVMDRIVKQAKQQQVLVSAFAPGRLRAARELRDEYPETVEFTEFGGLVGYFLALAGGTSGGLPSRGHNEAAIALACEALPEDSVFTRSSQTPGFHVLATRALNRLRDHGLQHRELAELAGIAPEPLAQRLLALSQIQCEAVDLLDKLGKRYNIERIQSCLEESAPLPYQGRLLILAGSDDAPMNLKWIKWVADRGVPTTVVVEAHPTESTFFEGAARIIQELGEEPLLVQRANSLTSGLFTRTPFSGYVAPLDVQVYSMPDPLSECEWILREILEELDRGMPPDRISIVARRLQEYAPLLEAAALRLGVPLSMAHSMPLMATGIVRFLIDLMEALADRTPSRLKRLLNRTYFGLSRDEADVLGKVIDDARGDDVDPWTTLIVATKSLSEAHVWLLDLLQWRHEAHRESRSLAAWLDLLKELGRLPWLDEAFREDTPTSQRDHYAINALQRSIAEIAAIERASDSPPITFRTFVRRCRARWENEEVSVPRNPGGVQVVSSGAELGLADTVFVLGLLEGVFPRKRREDPILHDEDLAWISSQIGTTVPDSHRQAREERDEFFRVCSAPARRLVLSYPLSGDEEDGVKAFYLVEVERLLGKPEHSFRREQLAPASPLAPSDIAILEAAAAPREAPLGFELHSTNAKESVRRRPREPYTIDDLRTVWECPFRFMAERRLHLDPSRTRTRWARIYGLPKLANLPAAESREFAEQSLRHQLDALIDRYEPDSSPEELVLLRLGGRRLVREWIQREFAARELWGRGPATPSPEHGKELKNTLQLQGGDEVDLKGTYAGMSQIGDHKVVHLFQQRDPIERVRGPMDEGAEMVDRTKFELGLTLATVPGNKFGGGLEIDHPGGRLLFLTPRPTQVPEIARGPGYTLYVKTLDQSERNELMTFVSEQLKTAIRRLDKPEVVPSAGTHCEFCDFGELCRRSLEFSEAPDPFAADFGKGDPGE